jgi:hypothetical protein
MVGSSTPTPGDRRKYKRVETRLRGKVFPGGLDCIIHDYSARGARLGFSGPPPAGERLVLVIWTTGLAFDATRRWTGRAEMGVQFRHPVDLRSSVPAHLAEIKAQWLNRRARLGRRELNNCGAIERWVAPREVRIS